MPKGYYDTQKRKQVLQEKKRKITEKVVSASKTTTSGKAPSKTFVNSFGEATKREIATTSYKNSQARLEKQIMGMIGGTTKKRKR